MLIVLHYIPFLRKLTWWDLRTWSGVTWCEDSKKPQTTPISWLVSRYDVMLIVLHYNIPFLQKLTWRDLRMWLGNLMWGFQKYTNHAHILICFRDMTMHTSFFFYRSWPDELGEGCCRVIWCEDSKNQNHTCYDAMVFLCLGFFSLCSLNLFRFIIDSHLIALGRWVQMCAGLLCALWAKRSWPLSGDCC